RLAQRGKITRDFLSIGNRGSERLTGSQPESFPAEKPKSRRTVVLRNDHRSAGVNPELVLDPWRPWTPRSVEKKIVGVKDFVAKILVRFAMHRPGPGLGAKVGHPARKLAPFRSQIAGLNFELLNRILRGNQHRQIDVTDVQRLAV